MIKFNDWGWIVCHENEGLHLKTMRFDTKVGALGWIREDPEHRWVDSENLIIKERSWEHVH